MLYEYGEQARRSGEDNVTGQVLLSQYRENLAEVAFSFGSSLGVVVPRRGSWPRGAGRPPRRRPISTIYHRRIP